MIFGEVFSASPFPPSLPAQWTILIFWRRAFSIRAFFSPPSFTGLQSSGSDNLGIIHKFLCQPHSALSPRPRRTSSPPLSEDYHRRSLSISFRLCSECTSTGIHYHSSEFFFSSSLARLFSTFSLIIACIVKTRERFMGIGQVLAIPLFFASNAIYPITIMPPWLKAIAQVNPLTYECALRGLMLVGEQACRPPV